MVRNTLLVDVEILYLVTKLINEYIYLKENDYD